MPGTRKGFTLQQAGPRGLAWLVERTSAGLTANARGIQAVDSKGVIRGVVAYDQWTLNSVQAHMAVDTPLAWRALLPHVFVYPFQHVGIILGIIPAGNTKSTEMVKRLGFQKAWTFWRGWSQTEDLVLWRMYREDCRYLAPSARVM
jgi:hypothetical protein